MKYSTPELVVLGTAAALVLGGELGVDDHIRPDFEQATHGVALGLDD
jgi:hypothetical protein